MRSVFESLGRNRDRSFRALEIMNNIFIISFYVLLLVNFLYTLSDLLSVAYAQSDDTRLIFQTADPQLENCELEEFNFYSAPAEEDTEHLVAAFKSPLNCDGKIRDLNSYVFFASEPPNSLIAVSKLDAEVSAESCLTPCVLNYYGADEVTYTVAYPNGESRPIAVAQYNDKDTALLIIPWQAFEPDEVYFRVKRKIDPPKTLISYDRHRQRHLNMKDMYKLLGLKDECRFLSQVSESGRVNEVFFYECGDIENKTIVLNWLLTTDFLYTENDRNPAYLMDFGMHIRLPNQILGKERGE